MITKPIGLYVHIPFCKQKCSYCDFVSFGGALSRFEEEYTEALVKEILEYKTEEKIKVDTPECLLHSLRITLMQTAP